MELLIILILIISIVFLEFKNFKLIPVDKTIKCFYDEINCMNGDINGSEIVYFILFLMIGREWPNRTLKIFAISVFIELVKNKIGINHKFIINPLVSMTGYLIGSVYFRKSRVDVSV